MKRPLALYILCLILSMGLLACDINGSQTGSSSPGTTGTGKTSTSTPSGPASPTAQPTPVPTRPGSTLAAELTRTITAYYNAIEAKNYTQAYTYLDQNATNTTTGQTLTRSSFIQQAQEMDNNEGVVISFDIGVFPPSTQVTMTVTRSHLGPYHALLNMKQENNAWKIVALDRI